MKKSSLKGRNIGLFAIVLALLTAASISIFVLQRKDNANAVPMPQQIIRPVKVMVLEGSSQNEIRTFPGVVQATREVNLAFRVGGPLIDLNARIGQRVNKGDIIARIDARDFEINHKRLSAALNEAYAGLRAMKAGARAEDISGLEARLNAAHVKLNDAKRNFERQRNLLNDHVIAQVEYDNALTAFDTAKANVDVIQQELKKARTGARVEDIQAAEARIKRLQANLKAAEYALNDTCLFAPFTGYVDKKYVENFENIGPGHPIVTLLDFSSLEIRTAVPEDIVIRREAIVDVTCTLEAYPGNTFPAAIKEIGRKTDQANHSYPLTVSFTTEKRMIPQPGMAATLVLNLEKSEKPETPYHIPASAVFADSAGQPCVFRVDTKKLRVIKTPVTTGSLLHDSIQITSGLSNGERIVIAGARFLQDNQEIRILSKSKGGAE